MHWADNSIPVQTIWLIKSKKCRLAIKLVGFSGVGWWEWGLVFFSFSVKSGMEWVGWVGGVGRGISWSHRPLPQARCLQFPHQER